MTRFLVVGAHGMLGHALRRALARRDLVAIGRSELDVTDVAAVDAAVARIAPDVVVNAAAYTRVDDAETHEDAAYAVNATGAAALAASARAVGARFAQVSTDYVFHGDAATPYGEDAPLDPLGAYGRTKAAGERLVREAHPGAWIVRTAWLYGAEGANFVRTMLRLAGERETVQVVTDQVGQPTWADDLAAWIVALADADAAPGVYHGTNAGAASWFELAQAVFAESGLDPARVLPTTSAAFLRPAPRPSYSVLGHEAWRSAGLPAPRPWREALRAALDSGVTA